jgi:hypothetical protein
LVACGGGGGSTPTSDPQPLVATDLQGRWATSASGSSTQVAVVLPSSAGSTNVSLWMLSAEPQTLSSLTKAQVRTTGLDGVTVSGSRYSLTDVSASETVTFSGTANLSTSELSLNAGTLLLTRSDTMRTTVSLTDVAGNWRSTAGGRQVSVDWTVATGGQVTASSTTGCTYAGTLVARTGVAALDANLTETCPGSVTGLSGIATHRPAQGSVPAALTMMLVNESTQPPSALAVLMSLR